MVSKHKYGSKMAKKKKRVRTKKNFQFSSELIISLLGAQVQGLLGESGSMCSRCYHNNRQPFFFFFSTKNRNRKIRTERKRGDTSSPTHHQKRIEYLDNQIEKKKKKKLSTPFQTKFHFPCVNNFLAGTKIQQQKNRERKEMKHFSFYANVEER